MSLSFLYFNSLCGSVSRVLDVIWQNKLRNAAGDLIAQSEPYWDELQVVLQIRAALDELISREQNKLVGLPLEIDFFHSLLPITNM